MPPLKLESSNNMTDSIETTNNSVADALSLKAQGFFSFLKDIQRHKATTLKAEALTFAGAHSTILASNDGTPLENNQYVKVYGISNGLATYHVATARLMTRMSQTRKDDLCYAAETLQEEFVNNQDFGFQSLKAEEDHLVALAVRVHTLYTDISYLGGNKSFGVKKIKELCKDLSFDDSCAAIAAKVVEFDGKKRAEEGDKAPKVKDSATIAKGVVTALAAAKNRLTDETVPTAETIREIHTAMAELEDAIMALSDIWESRPVQLSP